MNGKGKLWAIVAAVAVVAAAIAIFYSVKHDPSVPTEHVEAGATPVYGGSENGF